MKLKFLPFIIPLTLTSCSLNYINIKTHPEGFASKYWLLDEISLDDEDIVFLSYDEDHFYDPFSICAIEKEYCPEVPPLILGSIRNSMLDKRLPPKFIGYELLRDNLTSSVYHVDSVFVINVDSMFFNVNLDSPDDVLKQEAYRVGFVEECDPKKCSSPGMLVYPYDPNIFVTLSLGPRHAIFNSYSK